MLLHLRSISQLAGGRESVRRFFLVSAFIVFLIARTSAETQATVSESRGVYTVSASFTVAQPPADAMAVLTDYDHLSRFMPDLRASAVTSRSGSRVTVSQEAVSHFLTFSKQINLLLDINEAPLVLTFADRSGKSFSQYDGAWRLTVVGGQTVVNYTLVAKPSFSVPEFILSKLLKRDAGKMIAALQTEIAARAK